MILELEKQVVSLELAKQLKDAGFPQETLWVWKEIIIDGKSKFELCYRHDNGTLELVGEKWNTYRSFIWGQEKYAAPTVAELGEMLKGWILPYYNPDYTKPDETEADARALMWLRLKKEEKI